MATHSSILAWKIPWMEEAGGLQSMGCKESDMTKQFRFNSLHFNRDPWSCGPGWDAPGVGFLTLSSAGLGTRSLYAVGFPGGARGKVTCQRTGC